MKQSILNHVKYGIISTITLAPSLAWDALLFQGAHKIFTSLPYVGKIIAVPVIVFITPGIIVGLLTQIVIADNIASELCYTDDTPYLPA